MGAIKRVLSRDMNVGSDSARFPIVSSRFDNRLRDGQPRREVLVQRDRLTSECTTTGNLAYDRRAIERLQDVRQILARRKSALTGQQLERTIRKNVAQVSWRPKLPDLSGAKPLLEKLDSF